MYFCPRGVKTNLHSVDTTRANFFNIVFNLFLFAANIEQYRTVEEANLRHISQKTKIKNS